MAVVAIVGVIGLVMMTNSGGSAQTSPQDKMADTAYLIDDNGNIVGEAWNIKDRTEDRWSGKCSASCRCGNTNHGRVEWSSWSCLFGAKSACTDEYGACSSIDGWEPNDVREVTVNQAISLK